MNKYLKTLHEFNDGLIVSRSEELRKSFDESQENKTKGTLLDILIKATINGRPLSNSDIHEEVATFVAGGYDTTASAMSFTLYNLAKYPEVQQKAFDEIRQVIGNDVNTKVDASDLSNLKYLEKVIKETLRIYPTAPMIARKTSEDTLISM